MKNRKASKEQIISDIESLGLKKGDVIFIAADLLHIGYFNKSREQTYKDWVEILTTCVGEEGTIVLPSYTDTFFRYKKDKNVVFDVNGGVSNSGSLTNAFLSYSNYKRSTHPTSSCIAIGKYADYILQGHSHDTPSYLPYHRIIELKGKNLMLGAFSERKLAPMAMHAAQEKLGYTKKHWMAGFYQTYYNNVNGKVRLYTRKDPGGCTAGGYKLLGDLIIEGAINFGVVGNSLSALIDCEVSHTIFLRELKLDPTIIRCNNKRCTSCYGTKLYNPNKYLFFLIKYLLYLFLKK